ncbi:WD repeat-containing protein 17, partial [Perkinsus olseni]
GNGSTVLQLWNVSKRAPVGEMKVHGSAGVNAACCPPGDDNRIVASFRDGAVVIIDVKARGVRKVSGSSMETVFDCCFHPRDPNVFCTGSYDGCVKLWRMLSDINGDVDSVAVVVAEMSTATESDGGQPAAAKSKAIVYGVDFSYCGQKIAGVTAKGELHVWRVDTGRRVLLVPPNGPDQPSSYRVSWLKETSESPRSGWIAFARTDGNALVVDQLQDGRTVAVLDHHSPVFGVAWAPFAERSSPQLCTTALDGVVRVWSISPTNGVARISHSLRGHEGKAFNVLPHPLLRGIIASGGDDSTVRTVRVWDAPAGCCLHVHCDHAADVYGLASHPLRPFLFISTSRDSTIKLSTTEWLCRLPVVCVLFGEDPLAELASFTSIDDRDAILREFLDSSPEDTPGQPSPYMNLYGPGSARLLERLLSRDRDPLRDAVDIITLSTADSIVYVSSDGFDVALDQGPWSNVHVVGVEDIADVIRGLLGVARQHDGPGEYVHEVDLETACSSRAYNALAAATTAPSVVGNLAWIVIKDARGHLSVMPESRPSLGRAAELFLVNGDIRNYCEALARGRRWEAAIAVAPAVSLQYWQELCDRYVDRTTLSESSHSPGGRDEALPYLIAAGRSAEAIQRIVDRGSKSLEAMTLAKALADGRVPDRCVDLHIPRTPPGDRSHFDRALYGMCREYSRHALHYVLQDAVFIPGVRACGILLGSGQTEDAFALLGGPQDTLLHCGLRKMLHSRPSQSCAFTEKLARVIGELESVGRLPPMALIDFMNDGV